jgi:hypothetical protein
MAQQIARVDLSEQSRDFQRISVEAGRSMLDQGRANYRILSRWLGDRVAGPEWVEADKSVSFYVQQDGDRPLNVVAQLVSESDLAGPLRPQWEELQKKFEDAKPLPSAPESERSLYNRLQLPRDHRDCQLFKWKQLDGSWRLVWCWGYRRKDEAPGQGLICTDRKCSLLFVRRVGESSKCPACNSPGTTGTGKSEKGPRKPWRAQIVALVILAALVSTGIGYRFWRVTPLPPTRPEPGLIVTPQHWAGPVGGRIPFSVTFVDDAGNIHDVRHQTVAESKDPKVVKFEGTGTLAKAMLPGKTLVVFRQGQYTAEVSIVVEVPRNPTKLDVKPVALNLGIGSTERLQCFGVYEDGTSVDLTNDVDWQVPPGDVLFCYRGLVEGLSEGRAPVRVRYRASAENPYVESHCQVSVAAVDYKGLKLKADPSPLSVGQQAELTAIAVDAKGEEHSVGHSSRLELRAEPPQIARIEDRRLVGQQPGRATIVARFLNLNTKVDVDVKGAKPSTAPALSVGPASLRLLVGEVRALEITYAGAAPVVVTSSQPDIVAVDDRNRLVGRGEGKDVQVTVAQGASQATVDVEVVHKPIEKITIAPKSLRVAVDDTAWLRVIARAGDDQCELAPSELDWNQLPAAEFASFDSSALKLRGLRPTNGMAQMLTVRHGAHRASAQVEVIAAPFQLEVSPAGPIELTLGQSIELHASARYGDGRRVELLGKDVLWQSSRAEPGLCLHEGRVDALELSGSPVTVWGRYQGQDSNKVSITTAKDSTVALSLDADRGTILVGETGALRLQGRGSRGPVTLTAADSQFQSSDAAILAVDARGGTYRAILPGDVTVTARHPAATAPATATLKVIPREDARLVFRPDRVTVRVGERADLNLYLSRAEAGGTDPELLSAGSAVSYAAGRPDAVRWTEPKLEGLKPAEPFEFTATYQGQTATAVVHVLAEASRQDSVPLRVVPVTATLAPGQALNPKVEAKVTGAEQTWHEVAPEAVRWVVPDGLLWTPPGRGLGPSVQVPPAAKGPYRLQAQHGGQEASIEIGVAAPPAKLGQGDRLVLVREPEGDEIPVDRPQRYSVAIKRSNGSREPAPEVRWPDSFENEFVGWSPPVLIGKRAGHVEKLRAEVDKQPLEFQTTIVQAPAPVDPTLPPRQESPKAVRIVSEAGSPVKLPIGCEFRQFKVMADYGAGQPQREVTGDSTLSVEGDPKQAAVSVEAGKIAGERPGTATVRAEYRGVRSESSLLVEVTERLNVDKIQLEPASIELPVGETAQVEAVGSLGGKPVGAVSWLNKVEWKSRNPELIRVDGPMVTAIKPGRAGVTAQAGSVVSNVLEVKVVAAGASHPAELRLLPDHLVLRVGESKKLGMDVKVTRSGIDVSKRAEAAVTDPEIAEFHPRSRLLVGRRAGESEVQFSLGKQSASLKVEVKPSGPEDNVGTIVIEPSGGELGLGEERELSVFLVTRSGERINRTDSTLLEVLGGAAEVSGNILRGLSAGEVTVIARLPGIDTVGRTTYTVTPVEIARLVAEPASLKMNVGERRQLTIRGSTPRGMIKLFHHPELKVESRGQQPDAVAIDRVTGKILGKKPGNANVAVNWRGVELEVPVTVEGLGAVGELVLEPASVSIRVGEEAAFRAWSERGDKRRPLNAGSGATLDIGDPSVARPANGLKVRGLASGRTDVELRQGPLRATAQLTVTGDPPANPPPPPPSDPKAPLSFAPEVLKLDRSSTPAPFRVVRVGPEGAEEEVTQRAKIEIADHADVVAIVPASSGPTVKPLKAGRAQVQASLDGQSAAKPLLVDVSDQPIKQARLSITPDPLVISRGESASFEQAQVIPAPGLTPIPVGYRLSAPGDGPVSVEGRSALRGLKAGSCLVEIVAVDPGGKFEGLKAEATVEVVEPIAPPPSRTELPGRTDTPPASDLPASSLQLSGPTRITVGSRVPYRLEFVTAGRGREVTNEASKLVVAPSSSGGDAVTEVGCQLLARKAGPITLQAEYAGMLSNTLDVTVDDVATRFERLQLVLDPRPLGVGEARPYQILGTPASGTQQDLTGLVTAGKANVQGHPGIAVEVIRSAGKDDVVEHQPPRIIGRVPGEVQLVARMGDALRSEPVPVVVRAIEASRLRLEPSRVAVRVGERTPRLTGIVFTPTDPAGRMAELKAESLAPNILAPDPQEPGVFLARAPGQARVRAVAIGQEAFAEVTVDGDTPLSNAFESVTKTDDNVDPQPNGIVIEAQVRAPKTVGTLEYRLIPQGESPDGGWVAAQQSGDQRQVLLRSPTLPYPRDRSGTLYRLVIEAREPRDQIVKRYPYPIIVRMRTSTLDGEKSR